MEIALTSSATAEKLGPGRLWERSPQDLLAIFMPRMISLVPTLVGVCIIYDPEVSMSMLLYSALPKVYQNWLTFWFCFSEEMRFCGITLGVGIPALQCLLIAFDLLNNKLEEITAGAVRKR